MTRALLESGSVIGGKYRLLRMLGRGGMGSVFAAENLLTGKRVAIKCMHADLAVSPEASNRFLREAKASARIRHPNVVDVYDVLTIDGALYLIMELLEGEPLSEFLERDTAPLPQLVQMLVGAMRGVVAAHRQGVIHRDVKPENIFLAREGDAEQVVPKVLDFGISKIQGTQEIALTAPGSALGTVLYMATEQLSGAADVDVRADVYAFGVILYQAITGRLPFIADSFSALVLRIMTEPATPVQQLRPDVPSKLAELIEWAMVKQREGRLPSLDVFIRELEPFSDHGKYGAQWTRTSGRFAARPQAGDSAREAPSVPSEDSASSTTEWSASFVPLSSETPFVANDATLRLKPRRRWPGRSWSAALAAAVVLAVGGWGLWQHQQQRRSAATVTTAPAHEHIVKPVEELTASAADEVSAPQEARQGAQPTAAATTNATTASELTAATPAVRARPARVAGSENRARSSGNVASGARSVSTAPPAIPPAPAPALQQQPTKKVSCNPNFYLDAQGEKHFKPECF